MAYTPARGEIVHLQFDPASGQGMKGPHFGLVVSAKAFNSRGLAMICPISQGGAATARTYGTVVTLLGSGTDTQGAVHCHQLKSLDWRARKAKFKEAVPTVIIDDVSARLEAILFAPG
ncbi:MAG: type II toxin-antitoxin system PemK/MazF family toxin [Sulfurisoma sp.]|nr:type II toxin-antitoxin system PemK/MazF family toxin [Sulfurisoma sp.]